MCLLSGGILLVIIIALIIFLAMAKTVKDVQKDHDKKKR
jgi:hypothetical protein